MLIRTIFILFSPVIFHLLVCSGNKLSSNETRINETRIKETRINETRIKRQAAADENAIKLTEQAAKDSLEFFKEIIIKVILYSEFPMLSIFGTAIEFIVALNGGEKTVWQQVEDKVKRTVNNKIDDNNINLLSDKWNEIKSFLVAKSE